MNSRKSDFEGRRGKALAMGGVERLAKRRQPGVLNARARIAALFDPDSFMETGLFATSLRPEDRDRTPADGKITGYGQINGRMAAAASNDITVLGASSSTVNNRKLAHIKDIATKNGMPLVFLGGSSGGRIPESLGALGMGASSQDATQYMRTRETPWASAVLGPCFGSSVWYTCLADFVVMRKGATLAVASPRVTSVATGEKLDLEELGGWKLHAETTGLVDRAVDTDEEAIALIRRFLSYLPSHAGEAPPLAAVPEGSDEAAAQVGALVPEDRAKVYNVRKVIEAVVDHGSFFPLKERFARVLVTGLARIGGRSVGVMASNPLFKGGALDPDACDKAASFLVLCDSFNLPIISLVDTPGFLVGIDGERKKAPGRIMNFMQALQLCTVPKLNVIMRKLYGQAYQNMGGGKNSDEVAAWYTAEVSFMDPAVAVRVIHGDDVDEAKFAALREEMGRDCSAYELASILAAHHVIDPADTRRYLINALAVHSRARTNGVGLHRLALWPATL